MSLVFISMIYFKMSDFPTTQNSSLDIKISKMFNKIHPIVINPNSINVDHNSKSSNTIHLTTNNLNPKLSSLNLHLDSDGAYDESILNLIQTNKKPRISSLLNPETKIDSSSSTSISSDIKMITKSPSLDSVKTITENHELIYSEFLIKEIWFHVNSITSLKFSEEDFINVSEIGLSNIVNCLMSILSCNEFFRLNKNDFSHFSNFKLRIIVDLINCLVEVTKKINDEMVHMMETDELYFKNSLQMIYEIIKKWTLENLFIKS
jgi:hypothetical protein